MPRISERPNQNYFFQQRIKTIRIIVIIVISLIVIRAGYIQIIRGEELRDRARNNREEIIRTPAYRGHIYDRHYTPEEPEGTYQPLALNKSSICVYITQQDQKEKKITDTIRRLAPLLNLDPEQTVLDYWSSESAKKYRWKPYLLKENVSITELSRLTEHLDEFPGIYWQEVPTRYYPLRSTACHVIGYVGRISKREYKMLRDNPQYDRSDWLGKSGVEGSYDEQLRGKKGVKLVVRDARRRVKMEKNIQQPIPGNKLVLTIDLRIQQIVEKVLKPYSYGKGDVGTIIVSKPATGEILAMASYPWFDLNIPTSERSRLHEIDVEHNAFLNRAIQSRYPPSSIYKIITATAGLQEEIMPPTKILRCPGFFKFENDPHVFHCWGIHYNVNMYKALAWSCNVYFFNIGYQLGHRKLVQYSHYYGLPDRTGIDLPGEIRGFMPDEEWKRRVWKEGWYDGDTINMAIGQGFLLTTPMQLHNLICAVANGGEIYRPFIIKKIYNSATDELMYINKGQKYKKVPITERNLQIIRTGLRQVLTIGTAHVVGRGSGYAVAGKTGTAQLYKGDPHAWFTCYYPYQEGKNADENTIAITVFIEHGGGGGEMAAPLGMAVLHAINDPDADPVALRKYFRYRVITAQETYRALRNEQMEDTGASQRTDLNF